MQHPKIQEADGVVGIANPIASVDAETKQEGDEEEVDGRDSDGDEINEYVILTMTVNGKDNGDEMRSQRGKEEERDNDIEKEVEQSEAACVVLTTCRDEEGDINRNIQDEGGGAGWILNRGTLII